MGNVGQMGRNAYENGARGGAPTGHGGQVQPLVDRGYREDPYYVRNAPFSLVLYSTTSGKNAMYNN